MSANLETLPLYNLQDGELDSIERQAVDYALQTAPGKKVVGLVVSSQLPEANFGRTYEQRIFDKLGEGYDFSIGMAPYEGRSHFLYTTDTEERSIAHVKRLVRARAGLADGIPDDGLTGLEPIDDRLKATDPSEHMPLEELLERSDLSIEELGTVFNVATNCKTRRIKAAPGQLPYADLSYLSVFRYATVPERESTAAIVAYLNRSATTSLGRVGVESSLLAGKPFHLPRTTGGYDTDYEAVVIPRSPANLTLFTTLGELAGVPVIDYSPAPQ